VKRVVITGVGCISPAGLDVNSTWQNLVDGKDCSDRITKLDVSMFKAKKSCEVKNFHKNQYAFLKNIGEEYYSTQYACVALAEALKDNHLEYSKKKDIPVYLGINFQEPYALTKTAQAKLDGKFDEVDEETIYMNHPHAMVENIEKIFLLKGKHLSISAACAGGNYALTCAFDSIRFGDYSICVAGATTALSIIGIASFSKLGILAEDVCRPFDKNRKGLLNSEGAGMLIVEEYEHAIKRGAKIYAEILGYGITCDAYHPVAADPSGDGAVRAMKKALEMSNLNPKQIDYISAHGTGTPGNDVAEAKALHKVFGENLKDIPASSIKSMIGHSFAASSAMEAVVCCKVLENNILPPTINYQTPDPECDIDCVPNTARKKNVNIVMNNSFGFGGYNCITVFRKI